MRVIELETEAFVYGGAGAGKLPIKLRYELSEPLAVSLEFSGAGGVSVIWTFARELLDLGFLSPEPFGDGDVKVWCCGDDNVHIELSNSMATCEAEIDAEGVDEFLCATYELVPLGTEALNIPDDISELMA